MKTHNPAVVCQFPSLTCIAASLAVLITSAIGAVAQQDAAFKNIKVTTHRIDNRAIDQLRESFDAGDSYTTRKGPRSLRRLAGAVAVKAADAANAKAVVDGLTQPGRGLEGYQHHVDTKHGFVFLKAGANSPDAQLKTRAAHGQKLGLLRQTPGLTAANPVFVDPETGLWMLTTEEIMIALKPGVDARDYFGADWDRVEPLFLPSGQYLLKLTAAESEFVFAEVNRHASDPRVVWAEPSFNQQILKTAVPNDPMFNAQWYLRNTGQSGGTVNADVKATAAWDHTNGSSSVVIALLDDGFDLSHPDLIANVYTNAAEAASPSDGVDNDSDGYADNVRGWDFHDNDNNPNPATQFDNHGTAVAGMAVARGNNGVGIAGIAQNCRFLPLRIGAGNGSGGLIANGASLVYALYHAAGLSRLGFTLPRSADIIAMSIEFNQQQAFDDAIGYAATNGRAGKGCLIFTAAGNHGSGWTALNVTGLPSGNVTYGFRYVKDAANTQGEDAVWLSDVTFPDGTTERFDGASFPPPGWTTSGNANWTRSIDLGHARGRTALAVRSGAITHNQNTLLQTTRSSASGGAISYYFWVSSEANDIFTVDLNNNPIPQLNRSGVPFTRPGPSYPASHPEVMAVGASTDADLKAYYSQFGGKLDFVAPGGDLTTAASVTTTDRTGANGENTAAGAAGDYAGLQGTSFACPLAAGIGGLVLSVNSNLTRVQARDILRQTTARIGPEPYSSSGTNAYFGYGRLDASRALQAAQTSLNDACAGALEMTSFPYARTQLTTYATSAGDPIPGCGLQGSKGVWYKINSGNGGMLTVDSIGSGFDTILAVYGGNCGNLTPAICNDDLAVGNPWSSNRLTLAAFTTYYILAAGYNGATGNLTFHATFTPFLAPTGTVLAVQNLNPRAARVRANVDPRSPGATAWFEYGTNASYGQVTTPGVNMSGLPFEASGHLLGLTPQITYHYRLVASNSVGVFRSPNATFTTPADSSIVDITTAGDFYSATSTNSPFGETGDKAFDNSIMTKYLNFDEFNAGLIIVPSGNRVLQALTLISAEDAPERDPTSYLLEGSDDGVNFAQISSNAVPLFIDRHAIQSFNFANTNDYHMYRLRFPTVANAAAANSMQIAEIELLPYGEITSTNDTVSITMPPGAVNVRGVRALVDRELGLTNKLEIAPLFGGTNVVDMTLANGQHILKSFQVIGASDDYVYPERRPSSVTVAGSNDGTNYTVLRTVIPAAPSTNLQIQEFTVTNSIAYARYRVTFGPPVGGDRLQVGEMRLFGEPQSAPPVLAIQGSGANIVIRWPNAPGFNLEQKLNLNAPSWSPVGTAPVLSNGINTVTLPKSGSGAFFRLKR